MRNVFKIYDKSATSLDKEHKDSSVKPIYSLIVTIG